MGDPGSCSCCSCGCLSLILPLVLVILLIAGLVVFIIALLSGNATFYFEPISWPALPDFIQGAGAAIAAL
jgi:hypothetical protein